MSTVRSAYALNVASLALVVTFCAVSSVYAGTRISVGSMTVDGLEVRDLSCDVEAGGFLASAGIVGALAGQTAAFAKCGPDGEAARVSFEFQGTKTTGVKVLGASNKTVGGCVSRVLANVKPSTSGTCTATILTASNDRARAAAAELSPNKKAKPEPAKTEPEPAKKATELSKPVPEPTKTASAKPEPSPPKNPEPIEDELLRIYQDDANWSVVTIPSQGWQFWTPEGAQVDSISLPSGEDTWEGVKTQHDHQMNWLLFHPTAALTQAVVEGMTTSCLAKAKELQWITVLSRPRTADAMGMLVERATLLPHFYIRYTARGAHGSYFITGVMLEKTPGEIIDKWINSFGFFPPKPLEESK